MCDCIEKLQEKLREDTGDPETRVESCWSFSEGGIKQFMPIFFTYRRKKEDGSLSGKKVKETVIGTYCPICGKRLDGKAKKRKEAGK